MTAPAHDGGFELSLYHGAHGGHGCQWLAMAAKKRQAERHDVTTTRHIQLNQSSSVQFSPVQSKPAHFSPALQGTAPQLNAIQTPPFRASSHLSSVPIRKVRFAAAVLRL
jgi:hypothetical protein